MATLILPKGRLMKWNGNPITDHNRQPLAVDREKIEMKKRMADGTLRKYWVTEKRNWSTSWEMLPGVNQGTVDNYWGADQMEDFYSRVPGEFLLEISSGNSPSEFYSVMFTDFSKSLTKRGKFNFYDVSVSMEEV